MKQANGFEIIQMLERLAPKSLAYDWDKVGLQLGSLNQKMDQVLVTLDVVDEVVDEAIAMNAKLIIAHHPLIFNPLKSILTDTYAGKLIKKLLLNDIAVYVAHTNLDIAKGGVNDLLADYLGLSKTKPLQVTHTEKLKKLAVYVPADNQKQVKEALGNAGAGALGNYSHCMFTATGVGQFLPNEDANPAIGAKNCMEEVGEVRIETIVPESIEKKVISAMIKAHPYEEVAFDLYPMDIPGESLGLGVVGQIEEMSLSDFAEHVKTSLEVPTVRVVGDFNRPIKKVAVLGGSGSKYIHQAKFAGADCLVTGDIDYHTALDALALGLTIVDPGHNVEKVMKQGVVNYLEAESEKLGLNVKFAVSQVKTEPFQFL